MLWCWGANSYWGGTVSPLPDSELEAEAGACFSTSWRRRPSAKMWFGACWRCLFTDGDVLANFTSLSPKKKKKITGRGKKRAVESLKHPMARRTSRWKDPRFYFIFLNDQSSLTLCVCLCLNLEFNSRLCRVKLQTGSPSGDLALLQSNSYMFPYRPHLDLCLYVCFSCKVIRLQLASIWQRVFFFFSKSSAGKLYS